MGTNYLCNVEHPGIRNMNHLFVSCVACLFLLVGACHKPDPPKPPETASKTINPETVPKPAPPPSPAWANHHLWDGFEKTGTHASFAATIHEKLPEYRFRIVGRLNKADDFLPRHVEISRAPDGKIIQKLAAKDRFDNDGEGWDNGGVLSPGALVQLVDMNFDGYLDLRLLYNADQTGNNWYATYLFDPATGKFRYHEGLSRLSGIRIDRGARRIITYNRGGSCYESMGSFSISGTKLRLDRIEWTEMRWSRDKEGDREIVCFKCSAVPRSKGILLDPEAFIYLDADADRKHIRKYLKDVKEELLDEGLDEQLRGTSVIPISSTVGKPLR